MDADVSSGTNNMTTGLESVKNNMEDDVLSGKNHMENEDQVEATIFPGISSKQLSFEKSNIDAGVSLGNNIMAPGLASVKSSMEDDVLSGKNHMENEDRVEATSKPDLSKKKTTKMLRVRRKIVRKNKEGGGNTGIFSELQSSEVPSGEAVNPPKASSKRLSFGKNNTDTEVSPGKNNMEDDVLSGKNHMGNMDQVEATSKPELPKKKTTNMLRVRRKIVKKNKEGGGNTGIFSELQSSEVPSGEAVNPPKASSKQLSFGTNNTDTEVSPGKNNMEDDVLSGKNHMGNKDQVEATSKPELPKKKTTNMLRVRRKIVKKNKEGIGNTGIFSELQSSEVPSGEAVNPPKASTKQLSFGKNNTDTEVLPGKNNMEAENQGQASSKLEVSRKRNTKMLRVRRKLVKKCEETGVGTETASKLQSYAELGGKSVNPPKASSKRLSFGKNNLETEVLPGRNNMEAGNQGETSSKPESSKKKTSKMLRATPKIVKKPLAKESLKANIANDSSRVWRRNRMKNKQNLREETTVKNVTNKVPNEGNLEIKTKERIRWPDKSQLNQSKGKHGSSDKGSRQKNKEKLDGMESGQRNEMKSDMLGGMIFMCSAKTKPDCFHYRLMGVSMNKKDIVLGIKPGLMLFLYDFDLKLLYGIYKASSPGGLNIEHRAFGGAFPVQVRFDVHKDCLPVPESVFRSAIKENYNEKRKFKTELSVRQVRKLSELFRTLPGPGHSPAMPAVQEVESYVRLRESRPHSSRGKVGDTDNNDRSYPILPRERLEHISYHEITPQQREEISRDMYLSEKEYRAYGLHGERRKLTPPRRDAMIFDPYERDHAREDLIRQPYLKYEETVGVHGESSRIATLYSTEREYQGHKLGAKLGLPYAATAASVTATVLDHYERDPYYPYHYGAASTDSYQLPVRRDENSSGAYCTAPRIETYLGEIDCLQRREPEQVDRLYSTYAADALSNYDQISHYRRPAPRETGRAPVSSWHSPSLAYR